mgnify:CR=1 FL=1
MKYDFFEFLDDIRSGHTIMLNDTTECGLLKDSVNVDEIEVSVWPTYDHNNIEVALAIDVYNEYF